MDEEIKDLSMNLNVDVFKLPETKEEEKVFLERCAVYISAALEMDLIMKNKYEQIYKLSKDKKQKKEYKEKIEDITKKIEYFQSKLDVLDKRLEKAKEEN